MLEPYYRGRTARELINSTAQTAFRRSVRRAKAASNIAVDDYPFVGPDA